MKKQFMRVVNANLLTNFFKTTAIVLMLTGTYAVTLAAPASYAIEKNNGEGKSLVTHLYSDQQSLVFEIKVENASGEKFYIIVKDDNGSTLYRGSFTGKDFAKKFRVPKGDSNKIVFNVISKSGANTEVFEINTSTKVIEEVSVTKVM